MVAGGDTPAPASPLQGRTVLVTRARHQAASLIESLAALGARVVAAPVIDIVEPPDLDAVADAVRALPDYDWVVLTSVNGVERFFDRVVLTDRTAEALSHTKLAAVGRATAEAMRARGVEPDLIPREYHAEALVEALRVMGAGPGWRILVPRAFEGREVLPDELRAMGCSVDVVPVYRTVAATPDPRVAESLREGVDAITFTSPSTVKHFTAFAEQTGLDVDALRAGVLAASIGPVTTAALEKAGWSRIVEAGESGVDALVDAVRRGLEPRDL